MLVQYATAKAGIVLVNVNPAYRTSELEYALRQSGCRALIAAPSFKTSDYRAMVESGRGDLPQLERVVLLDTPDWEALAAGADADVELPDCQFDDAINIQYTSGTTGFPKGATLSHHNILNNGYFVAEGCRYTEAGPGLHPRALLPLLRHGDGQPRLHHARRVHGHPGAAFEPEATLRGRAGGALHVALRRADDVHRRARAPGLRGLRPVSLRTGIMAGSPCPIEVMRRVVTEMHMEDVTICYGMTETSPVSTQTGADDPLDQRVGTVGRMHPHVEVKVVDPETGRVVGREEPGELCTRGYSVMLGYWDEPEKTAEAIDRARWMHTGDLATMDDEGYLKIVGRIKDMVIRGGENIYPREVEEFLYAHPDVADVQVVGVPDQRYGEELMAWIVPRGGAEVDRDAIASTAAAGSPTTRCRATCVVDEFPMTVTGKVQKYKLREMAIEQLGLEDAAAIETAELPRQRRGRRQRVDRGRARRQPLRVALLPAVRRRRQALLPERARRCACCSASTARSSPRRRRSRRRPSAARRLAGVGDRGRGMLQALRADVGDARSGQRRCTVGGGPPRDVPTARAPAGGSG